MNRDLLISTAAILLVGGICFGLASAKPDFRPTESVPFSVTTGPKPMAANEKIVMRVNGEPVTEREFLLFLQQAPEQAQSFYRSDAGREALAQQLVRFKVLEQEGRRIGVENDPEIAARLSFEQDAMIASGALRKLVAEPKEEDLRREYDKRSKELETVELSHIVLAYQGSMVSPRNGRAPSPAEAMQRARALELRLRAGADFAAVARTESDDAASAARGGLLGPAGRGALPPQLEAVVFELAPGAISAPVQSNFGVHIFKAGGRGRQKFEDVRPALRQQLTEKAVEARVQQLQAGAKVDLDPKFFPKRASDVKPETKSP